jgi:hypothetical protein
MRWRALLPMPSYRDFRVRFLLNKEIERSSRLNVASCRPMVAPRLAPRHSNTVSTGKKSAARMVFAWPARNARQACAARLGARSMLASLRIFHTVDGATVLHAP